MSHLIDTDRVAEWLKGRPEAVALRAGCDVLLAWDGPLNRKNGIIPGIRIEEPDDRSDAVRRQLTFVNTVQPPLPLPLPLDTSGDRWHGTETRPARRVRGGDSYGNRLYDAAFRCRCGPKSRARVATVRGGL
jgi:hypothetical protein